MGRARGNTTFLHEKCNFLKKKETTWKNESKAAKLFLTQSGN